MKNISTALLQLMTSATLLLSAAKADAQRIDCNSFMLGKHIELGVNWNGAFGTSAPPPAASHPNTSTSLHNTDSCGGALYTGTSLAMVADADADGWATYFGDFVLPGGPNEGWSIMFNSAQKNFWNSDAATSSSIPAVNSYIFGYSDTIAGGTIIETKTQSVYDGIYTTQWIRLDTGKLFFTVHVLIENTTLASAGDMYYMRMINPHNDQVLSGNPATWNKIENQVPGDTALRAIVSARGTIHSNAYLAMGTRDDRARVFITKNGQLPSANTIDYINFGDTSFLYNVNDSINANTSMGITYNLGLMVSGGYTTFDYFYAFRPDVIDEAIHNVSLGVKDVHENTVAHYHVYPNPITSTFKLMGVENTDVVQLFDMTGRLMICDRAGTNDFTINDLASGTYMVVIRDKTGAIKGRVPVQKI